MTLRVAIYARYSSDNQRDASIEDQIRLCKQRITQEGWQLEQVYRDAALSGASTLRPGYQALLTAARDGGFDVVLAEALDRLSRDQEDIAGLYKRLKFAGIKIVTLAEGEVSELHIGLKGTMNALFLKDLAAKTHRGMQGRVAAGKSASGLSFGYRAARQLDSNGEVKRGDRVIDDAEAAIVRHIFQSFAEGLSPIAIAKALNAEAVPGPGGRPWQDTTIRGHAARGTGILRNELYVGRLIWNRMQFIKDPATGKRVSRMNDASAWVTKDVPELRIIDQPLWDSVQQRLAGIREVHGASDPDRPKYWETRRAQHLLTGKMFCTSCGGALSAVGRDYLACGAARKRGTCSNTVGIRRSTVESAVIDALRANLMEPDDVREFVEAFTSEWNRVIAESNAGRAHDQNRLTTIQRKIDKIIEAVMDGFRTEEMKQQLEALSQEKAKLQARLSAPQAPAPALHPNLAEVYRAKVGALHDELAKSDSGNTAVLEALRDLIDRVELGPKDANGEPEIILTGALASMVRLGMGQAAAKLADRDLFLSSVKVVAGARFELTTFRL